MHAVVENGKELLFLSSNPPGCLQIKPHSSAYVIGIALLADQFPDLAPVSSMRRTIAILRITTFVWVAGAVKEENEEAIRAPSRHELLRKVWYPVDVADVDLLRRLEV